MNYVTINGKDYSIPEVDFEAICKLEESGVNLLQANRKNPKLATTLRGIVAWIMDAEPEEASAEIQAHIQNGGDLGDIMLKVTQAINNSGFFKQAANGNQDGKVAEFQNRSQRRKNQKSQKNTEA